MGPFGVVVRLPLGDDVAGLRQRSEAVRVEALVAKAAVEALGECVLGRFARLNELEVDAVVCRPLHEPKARELAAVVADDATWLTAFGDGAVEHLGDLGRGQRARCLHRDRLAGEVVDRGEHPVAAAVFELVVHVALAMPCLRQRSVTGTPCSASFKMPMIWDLVYRLRFMEASRGLETPVSHGPKNRSHVNPHEEEPELFTQVVVEFIESVVE